MHWLHGCHLQSQKGDDDHGSVEYLENLIADEAGLSRGPLERHLHTKQASAAHILKLALVKG